MNKKYVDIEYFSLQQAKQIRQSNKPVEFKTLKEDLCQTMSFGSRSYIFWF